VDWLKKRPAFQFSLLYIVLGALWFLGGAKIGETFHLHWRSSGKENLIHDLSFVLVSGAILYFVLFQERKTNKKLALAKKSTETLYANIIKQVKAGIIIFDLDHWKVQLVSEEFSKFFEYSNPEIQTKPELLLDRLHPEDRERIQEIWVRELEKDHANLIYRIQFPDGRQKWALENRTFLKKSILGLNLAVSVLHDISDNMNYQVELQAKNRENLTLLSEIHHRVKNNLAIIISLLQLQSYNSQESEEILKESISRVKAIALVHEKIYNNKNLSSIGSVAYFHDLAESVKYTFHRLQVQIQIQAEDIELDISTAVPLGLLVNELLTNSMRHAFAENSPGQIKITWQKQGGNRILEFSDDGKGFPPGFVPEEAKTLGFTMITNLTNQLYGKRRESKSPFATGVHFSFLFFPNRDQWRVEK